MAKWPQVETPLDGAWIFGPGTGYIPQECSWSLCWVALTIK